MELLKDDPILFGGDYNPEQWPKETWQEDIEKLKAANVNSATINVFSWALLEPSEGKFNFNLLNETIKSLEENDMKIILATSTGAIPAWISRKYPEVNRVDVKGTRQVQGKRHNACPNSKQFKRLIRALVKQLGKRYSTIPGLVAWHVSNEYGGYCYCEQCTSKFREWLHNKYKSLMKLNESWNSNFWSHTINDWNEIEPPMETTDLFSNGKSVLSGQEIDYRRFQSESLLEDYIIERDIIRQFDTIHPITTNFMGDQKDLDYFKWAPELDIISWDNYPMPNSEPSESAMNHDLMRGLKAQPFMLMEQTPNQQNWYPYNQIKQPGEMEMLSYQALAHGANSIEFFQLKQSRSGAEKFHGAVLELGDDIHSRVYNEVAQLGKSLKSLPGQLKNAKYEANVAMIFDWESFWGLENSIGPIEELKYIEEFKRFYKAFYKRNISVDIISKSQDFEGYSVVVAPVLYMWSNDFVKNIKEYVKGGGNFLTSYMSGIADETDRIFVDGYLSPLKDVMGIRVDERDARAIPISVTNDNGKILGSATGVCDLIIPESAKALSYYGNEAFYSTYASSTVNEFGSGNAFYCGAGFDDQSLQNLIGEVLKPTNIESEYISDVEICVRTTEQSRFIFVINTSNKIKEIYSPLVKGLDLIEKKKYNGQAKLLPFETIILKENKE